MAWEQEREREEAAVAAQFSSSRFLAISPSFSSSGKSHLGLVVDRQHDLIDAGVLEGLFWGVIERKSAERRREKGSEILSLFFPSFSFFCLWQEANQLDRLPPAPPMAPSAVYLPLPTLACWCQKDVRFALA